MSDIARRLQKRRNELCVAPEFPGVPDDYTYVPERCVPKRREARGSRRIDRPGKLTKSGVRKELEVVNAVLRTTETRQQQLPQFRDLANAQEFLTKYRELLGKAFDIFKAMIQRPARAAHPNPVERFEALSGDVPTLVVGNVRREVFRLLEAHLEALLQ